MLKKMTGIAFALLALVIVLVWIDIWLFDGCPDTQRANALPAPYRTWAQTIHRHLGG